MYKEKKVIAIVPARGGSKGIKLKNLLKINRISLIGHTSKFIDSLNIVDLKVLSSDHKLILKEGKKYKFYNFKRPKKFSGDSVSDFEVINNVLEYKEFKNKFDYLIYLQPTSILRSKKQLLNAFREMLVKHYDSSWAITKVDRKFHPLKILSVENKKLFLNNSEGKKIVARQQLKDCYTRNGNFYIFNVKKLLKKKSIYLNKILPSVSYHRVFNIDTWEDYVNLKSFLSNNKSDSAN